MPNVIPLKVIRTLGDTTALAEYSPGDFVDPIFLPAIADQGGVPNSHLSDTNPHNITAAMLNVPTIADLNNHTNNLTLHRTINDGGSGITDLWSAANITTLLSQKSDTTHNHDGVYYTQAQVDLLVGSAGPDKVKTSAADSTAEYLADSIVDGQGTTVSESTGTNKTLAINNSVYVDTINGQPMPVFVDSTRGKVLSSELSQFLFAENALSNNEWIKIGRATDGDSCYIMPFDGTIVGVTAHCENTNGNTKDIRLYTNTTETDTTFITFSPTSNSIYSNMSKNIDVSADDRIRLRASVGGSIQDTVITLFIRWKV